MTELSDQTHVLDLLPAYALGSLDAEELRRVDEHLLHCLICREESSALESVAAHLSLAIPVEAPSAGLRDRLMERVQTARPRLERSSPAGRSRSFWERLLPVWGVASLLLIVALTGFSLLLWQRVDQIEFSTSAGMRAVPLSPTDAASTATGFVLISADGEDGALIVDGLPPLGEDRQYQLWLVRDDERTSGAIFSTDENNYGGTRIRAPLSLLEYSSVGITIEPFGGSSQPTGERVLGGPLLNP
jgi:anti-sigma-K factor RskA